MKSEVLAKLKHALATTTSTSSSSSNSNNNNGKNFNDITTITTIPTKQHEPLIQWDVVTVTHSDLLCPCEIYDHFHSSNVVITSHGFQCMSLIFMKANSMIIEIFNYKYWKLGYTQLSLELGISHRWFQNTQPTSWSRVILYWVSQPTCMNSAWCRHFARRDDITVDDSTLFEIVTTLKLYSRNIIKRRSSRSSRSSGIVRRLSYNNDSSSSNSSSSSS